jgi:hypothetical protein
MIGSRNILKINSLKRHHEDPRGSSAVVYSYCIKVKPLYNVPLYSTRSQYNMTWEGYINAINDFSITEWITNCMDQIHSGHGLPCPAQGHQGVGWGRFSRGSHQQRWSGRRRSGLSRYSHWHTWQATRGILAAFCDCGGRGRPQVGRLTRYLIEGLYSEAVVKCTFRLKNQSLLIHLLHACAEQKE